MPIFVLAKAFRGRGPDIPFWASKEKAEFSLKRAVSIVSGESTVLYSCTWEREDNALV
jgi:hypothetical protein